MKSFSELVSKQRKELGLSMSSVSRLLQDREGVKASKSLINALEKGDRTPTYEIAHSLSKVLDIDLEEILIAAYLSRKDHFVKRESDYIDDLTNAKDLTDIDAYRIVNKAQQRR
ncbi:MAG: helix-turn-helix transcriptional regulator [Actinobacteria bacterium]|nr:helix-turn-helix transcriptional regulator [Actinomycetota bacterium]